MFAACINYFIVTFSKTFDIYQVMMTWHIFKANMLIGILLTG